MAKEEPWEPCPRCGGNRVTTTGKGTIALMGIGMISIFFWFLFLFPPAGIIGMVVGAALLLMSPFVQPMLSCQDCKKSWKYKPIINTPDPGSIKIEVKNIDMDSDIGS